LFRNYVYVSGTTKTLDDYFTDFVRKCKELNLDTQKVLEIASNDGSLLTKFNSAGWTSIGVDPAINLIEKSTANGVTTIPEFFDVNLAKKLAKDFSLIIAMNVFAHTSNPLEILLAAKEVLDDNGVILIQTSQADMMLKNQIDTIYHEHISFFNTKSMEKIVKRSGMFLSRLEIVPIHGNSYLWYITKKPRIFNQSNELMKRIETEEQGGLFDYVRYSVFSSNADNLREVVSNHVKKFKNSDFKIAVYGAAAKGNTLINFCDIKVDYVYDDNELKIGKYSPIDSCIVEDPRNLSGSNDNFLFIITAWNFVDEIIEKIKILRPVSDDWYLVYYPNVKVERIHG
jgi:2-polyprenyl-3-methyl-5-hydroxy-6-metoxy-1,4-benzoquinol methylase